MAMLSSVAFTLLLTALQVPAPPAQPGRDVAKENGSGSAVRTEAQALPPVAASIKKTATIAAKTTAPPAKKKKKRRSPLAPMPEGTNVEWSHAPFETGDCDLCHERRDAEDPGDVQGEINDLCLDCHEEIAERLATRTYQHEALEDDCTACHNPHDAKRRMLLLSSVKSLCLDCHSEVGDLVNDSAVDHGAINEKKNCINCHDPHASNIENLLHGIASDLCLDCHGPTEVLDNEQKPLTDMVKLLADNPVRHPPVDAGDCAACHQPHGSEHMRLLVAPYPETFYSSFNLDGYALCLGCHDKENLTEERTTALTGFRDGDRNLHFVHVNRENRGRTCRACHEVHAAKQPHLIRDSVPYGSRGWMLKLNYQPEEHGGTCSKTCHSTRSYNRLQAVNVEGAK
jgi:predicted CXXCH cytochrome family protein